MQTLSTDDLDLVTGGKSPLGGNNSSGGDDALLTTLQGIQSSLKDLGKNQNAGGLFGGGSGLLFMTMALAMSNRQSSVVMHGSCNRRGHCFRW